MDKSDELAISCIQHAIADTQEVIRAYDNKAEILSVLVTLLVGFTNYAYFSGAKLAGVATLNCLIITIWILGLVVIFLLALVLYPRSNKFSKISPGSYVPKNIYFVRRVIEDSKTIEALAQDAKTVDWVSELTYESMKLSLVREHKHKLFIWSLRCLFILLLSVSVLVVVGALNG